MTYSASDFAQDVMNELMHAGIAHQDDELQDGAEHVRVALRDLRLLEADARIAGQLAEAVRALIGCHGIPEAVRRMGRDALAAWRANGHA